MKSIYEKYIGFCKRGNLEIEQENIRDGMLMYIGPRDIKGHTNYFNEPKILLSFQSHAYIQLISIPEIIYHLSPSFFKIKKLIVLCLTWYRYLYLLC